MASREKKNIKKCELCDCEVYESDDDFDFCFECLNGRGKCEKCNTNPHLDQFTELRLKSELTMMTADWVLVESKELKEMMKEFVKSSKKEKS